MRRCCPNCHQVHARKAAYRKKNKKKIQDQRNGNRMLAVCVGNNNNNYNKKNFRTKSDRPDRWSNGTILIGTNNNFVFFSSFFFACRLPFAFWFDRQSIDWECHSGVKGMRTGGERGGGEREPRRVLLFRKLVYYYSVKFIETKRCVIVWLALLFCHHHISGESSLWFSCEETLIITDWIWCISPVMGAMASSISFVWQWQQ